MYHQYSNSKKYSIFVMSTYGDTEGMEEYVILVKS